MPLREQHEERHKEGTGPCTFRKQWLTGILETMHRNGFCRRHSHLQGQGEGSATGCGRKSHVTTP